MPILEWIFDYVKKIKWPLLLISLLALHLILFLKKIWNRILLYSFIATSAVTIIYGALFSLCYFVFRRWFGSPGKTIHRRTATEIYSLPRYEELVAHAENSVRAKGKRKVVTVKAE